MLGFRMHSQKRPKKLNLVVTR